jgi:hypothetical protein
MVYLDESPTDLHGPSVWAGRQVAERLCASGLGCQAVRGLRRDKWHHADLQTSLPENEPMRVAEFDLLEAVV